jgi:DNA (cytosine-5)-methyltransferase 1
MIRSLEIFSGAEGLALGLHQAGFDPVALIEKDRDSRESVMKNKPNGYEGMGDWNIVQADVRGIGFPDYGQDIQSVAGGPPCRHFPSEASTWRTPIRGTCFLRL